MTKAVIGNHVFVCVDGTWINMSHVVSSRDVEGRAVVWTSQEDNAFMAFENTTADKIIELAEDDDL